MQVLLEPVTKAVIRPRMDRIDLVTGALGCKTDVHRAAIFGLTDRTISRARGGDHVGAVFVANVLATLREYERALAAKNLRATFDELFEVVVIPIGAGDDRP